MPAYAVGNVVVSNPDAMMKYVERMPALMAKYKGRILANDRAPTLVEGQAPVGSTIVIEFPDVATAKAFYADPEYKTAKGFRVGAATLNLVIVAGL
jgi:uncharacterized protein (DUF1330 family)